MLLLMRHAGTSAGVECYAIIVTAFLIVRFPKMLAFVDTPLTARRVRSTIRSMKTTKSETHDHIMEQDLHNLESRIEALIQICDRLREENTILRDQQTSLLSQQTRLLAERAHLIKKTEVVSSRVESMILRFKSMEYDA